MLDMQAARQNRIEFYIEDLPLRCYAGSDEQSFLEGIPPEALISLKLGIPMPPLTARLQSLKQLLVRARNLQTLHYQDRGQGTQFIFAGAERLPAFKELRLVCYDWNHDSDQVAAHWNFSRIRSLELVSMPTYAFLTSVSFQDFASLHTLRVEDFSVRLFHRQEEATAILHRFVRDHIRALSTLDIRVHTHLFLIDAILRHSSTLHILRFRDHIGFNDETARCPTLSVAELTTLSEHLTNLHTLELDMDMNLVRTDLFLRALGLFPRLHTLTIHIHTLLKPDDTIVEGSDRDRDFALRMFSYLIQTKKPNAPQWRSITINVGGWQRVTVRRFSEAWKALNRRGIYAERCFVLDRLDNGDYRPREETPLGDFARGCFRGSGGSEGSWDGGLRSCCR